MLVFSNRYSIDDNCWIIILERERIIPNITYYWGCFVCFWFCDTWSPETHLLDMDDFRHHSWMGNDTGDIKPVILCNNDSHWFDSTVVWQAVFRIEME